MSNIRIWLDNSNDDYEIVSRHFALKLGPVIGFGDSGCVYALRHDATRVVKFTEIFEQRFPQECEVAAFMAHLGVGPRVYEHFTLRARSLYNGRLVSVGALIMERLETTLYTALRRQPDLLAQLWPDMCRQIRTVAQAGYCLCDLHPRNVMLHQGRVRFIDFEWVNRHTLDTPTVEAAVDTMCRIIQRSSQNPMPPTRMLRPRKRLH